MGGNIWSLLVILAIVLLLFGTKKLRNIGKDVGGAIKGFKDASKGNDAAENDKAVEDQAEKVIEGEVTSKEKDKV